ncbi:RNA polymerase sigma factor [Planotetraspora thailandica]|uniref:RNA polymerase sigma factor n=1 Tax=Planotetraspora thailandica TaxID=487172 RepID=UPI001EF2BF30|nr:RNA polymerase sigma factor [Planotetraspora thailandica]
MSTAAGHQHIRPWSRDTATEDPQSDPGDHASDAGMIRASLADPDQFAGVFDRHSDEIHAYASRRLGLDHGHADDVTAETFLIAFRKRHRYDLTRADARPWLYGIAANLIAGHRRSEVRRLKALARTAAYGHELHEEERSAERASAAALRPALAAALARLSSAERETLLLVAWADLSYEETAQALQIPVGTVRSRIHRVRAKLRRHLDLPEEETS